RAHNEAAINDGSRDDTAAPGRLNGGAVRKRRAKRRKVTSDEGPAMTQYGLAPGTTNMLLRAADRVTRLAAVEAHGTVYSGIKLQYGEHLETHGLLKRVM